MSMFAMKKCMISGTISLLVVGCVGTKKFLEAPEKTKAVLGKDKICLNFQQTIENKKPIASLKYLGDVIIKTKDGYSKCARSSDKYEVGLIDYWTTILYEQIIDASKNTPADVAGIILEISIESYRIGATGKNESIQEKRIEEFTKLLKGIALSDAVILEIETERVDILNERISKAQERKMYGLEAYYRMVLLRNTLISENTLTQYGTVRKNKKLYGVYGAGLEPNDSIEEDIRDATERKKYWPDFIEFMDGLTQNTKSIDVKVIASDRFNDIVSLSTNETAGVKFQYVESNERFTVSLDIGKIETNTIDENIDFPYTVKVGTEEISNPDYEYLEGRVKYWKSFIENKSKNQNTSESELERHTKSLAEYEEKLNQTPSTIVRDKVIEKTRPGIKTTVNAECDVKIEIKDGSNIVAIIDVPDIKREAKNATAVFEDAIDELSEEIPSEEEVANQCLTDSKYIFEKRISEFLSESDSSGKKEEELDNLVREIIASVDSLGRYTDPFYFDKYDKRLQKILIDEKDPLLYISAMNFARLYRPFWSYHEDVLYKRKN